MAGRRDKLATAHEHWDEAWRDAAGREDWLEPEPAVLDVLPSLHERGVHRVLDLGCGVGRHARAFATAGFETHAIDAAIAGVTHAASDYAGDSVGYAVSSFVALPYSRATFDYVLAWNVVYHGDGEIAGHAIEEIARVLRPGGTYQSTMLSKRHTSFGRGTEVRPDTWVDSESSSDKAHPHLFTTSADARALHDPWFEVEQMDDREQREPGSWHLELVMRRR